MYNKGTADDINTLLRVNHLLYWNGWQGCTARLLCISSWTSSFYELASRHDSHDILFLQGDASGTSGCQSWLGAFWRIWWVWVDVFRIVSFTSNIFPRQITVAKFENLTISDLCTGSSGFSGILRLGSKSMYLLIKSMTSFPDTCILPSLSFIWSYIKFNSLPTCFYRAKNSRKASVKFGNVHYPHQFLSSDVVWSFPYFGLSEGLDSLYNSCYKCSKYFMSIVF